MMRQTRDARGLHRAHPLLVRLCFACAFALLFALPAAAQSVRGRVLDRQTNAPVPDVRVALVRANGEKVHEVISDAQGRFHVVAQNPGQFRLQTSHIAYRDVSTEPFSVSMQEQVVVDLKITASALALEPLTIVARRVDPRHLASEEGMFARRQRVAPIGNTRIFLPSDPEMSHAGTVRDLTDWTGRPRACTVMFWNGVVVSDSTMTQEMWNMPVDLLEGVEYYRNPSDAPNVFQEKPAFMNWTDRGGGALCSVVALWPRTGRYTEEYVPPLLVEPLPWITQLALIAYRPAGDFAPGIGIGIELNNYWPIGERIQLGVHLRGTRHTLDADAADSLTSMLSNITYQLPPGDLPISIVVAAVEPRVSLLETDRMRLDLGLRAQGAVRRFAIRENVVGEHYDRFNSRGWGGGAVAGLDLQLSPSLAASFGLGYDWMRFEKYPQTDRAGESTAADWTGAAFRFGIVYGH